MKYLSDAYKSIAGKICRNKNSNEDREIIADVVEINGKQYVMLSLEDYAVLATLAGVEPDDISGSSKRAVE